MHQTPALSHEMVDPAPIRFLDDGGNYAPSDTAAEYAAELDGIGVDEFQQWYRDMVTTRAFDTECTHLQRQGLSLVQRNFRTPGRGHRQMFICFFDALTQDLTQRSIRVPR